MIKMMIAISLLCTLSNCGTRTVYVKQKPHQFQTIDTIVRTPIRVHPDDAEIFEAYTTKCREIIDHHNESIEMYRRTFE